MISYCILFIFKVGQVVIVGEIVEVTELPTNIVYKIHDRMGPEIEVRRWVEEVG